MVDRFDNSGDEGVSGPGFSKGERVLFVDDEELVAYMSSRLLELHGYQVTYRTNGADALELFRFQPEKYDILITDHCMPHMTGVELCREVLKIRPDLPIILCTANHNITEQEAKQHGARVFMAKPLDGSQLVRNIRAILDKQ